MKKNVRRAAACLLSLSALTGCKASEVTAFANLVAGEESVVLCHWDFEADRAWADAPLSPEGHPYKCEVAGWQRLDVQLVSATDFDMEFLRLHCDDMGGTIRVDEWLNVAENAVYNDVVCQGADF